MEINNIFLYLHICFSHFMFTETILFCYYRKSFLQNVNLSLFVWFFDVVGWCGAYSRIFWKSKGGRDAVASICGKTLPHSAGRELKPSHAGRGGWVPAESLSRDLEGRLLVVTITYTELYSHSLQNRTELYECHNWLVDEGYVLHTHTHTHTHTHIHI